MDPTRFALFGRVPSPSLTLPLLTAPWPPAPTDRAPSRWRRRRATPRTWRATWPCAPAPSWTRLRSPSTACAALALKPSSRAPGEAWMRRTGMLARDVGKAAHSCPRVAAPPVSPWHWRSLSSCFVLLASPSLTIPLVTLQRNHQRRGPPCSRRRYRVHVAGAVRRPQHPLWHQARASPDGCLSAVRAQMGLFLFSHRRPLTPHPPLPPSHRLSRACRPSWRTPFGRA